MKYIKFRGNTSKSAALLTLIMMGVLLLNNTSHISQASSGILISNPQLIQSALSSPITTNLNCIGESCFTDPVFTDPITNAGGAVTGTGTDEDPFIIQNLNISGASITVRDTSKSFIIRNNTISGSGGTGIHLATLTGKAIVENNSLSGQQNGIYVRTITNTLSVRFNNFTNMDPYILSWAMDIGILSYEVNSTSIYGNRIINAQRGIQVRSTNSSLIYNNLFKNITSTAMEITLNNVTHIHHNSILDGGIGMRLSNNISLVEYNDINNLTSNDAAIWEYQMTNEHLTNRTYRFNTISNVETGVLLGSFIKIENNTLINIGAGGIFAGNNVSISGNHITNFNLYNSNTLSNGIYASYNATISENIISQGNRAGIQFADHANVTRNSISHVLTNGIDAGYSQYSILSYNVITNSSSDGINLGMKNNTAINNIITGSHQNGIYVSGNYHIIKFNSISSSGGSGIMLDLAYYPIVEGNTISTSTLFSIYALSSQTAHIISNTLMEAIGLDAATGTGTPNAQTFKGYTFSENTVNGLPFGYFDAYASDITGSFGQLYIVDSPDIKVTGISISNTKIPITILFTTSIRLENLVLDHNHYYAIRSKGNPGGMIIVNSTITHTQGTGILSELGLLVLINSTVSSSTGLGISVNGSGSIFGSTVSNNQIGLRLGSISTNYVVSDSTFSSNLGYAISVDAGSSNIRIHHNNFLDNNGGGTSQAYDSGASTLWYEQTTQEGNYWSDYSGSGSYQIDSPSNTASDLYPFGSQIVLPRVDDEVSSSEPGNTSTPTESETNQTSPSDSLNESNGGFLNNPVNIMILLFTFSISYIYLRRKHEHLF